MNKDLNCDLVSPYYILNLSKPTVHHGKDLYQFAEYM